MRNRRLISILLSGQVGARTLTYYCPRSLPLTYRYSKSVSHTFLGEIRGGHAAGTAHDTTAGSPSLIERPNSPDRGAPYLGLSTVLWRPMWLVSDPAEAFELGDSLLRSSCGGPGTIEPTFGPSVMTGVQVRCCSGDLERQSFVPVDLFLFFSCCSRCCRP